MARFRRSTSKGNTYLQYVQSYRNEQKQPATRVLANLGNISKMSEEQIEQMSISFIKALGLEKKFQPANIQAGKGFHYGTCLPAIAIWQQLDMDRIINNALSKKVEIPVARISLIQTANRFSDPGSKLACYRWHSLSLFSRLTNFVTFPEDDESKLHTYYRSLDYLCEAKEKIEMELYYHFKSYGIDNRLVLYDITSVYFEGSDSEIGEKGYSRDWRPASEQVVIGLVMSRDGIPIAHHVFEGNRLDKTTVSEVVEDLDKRFSLKEIVFVGDRGMLTVENIDFVRDCGNNYIMGMQKRNRRIIRHLLKKIEEGGDLEAEVQQFTYADLSEEFNEEYNKGVRFIACYNSDMASLHKETREKNIANFEELIKCTELAGKLDTIKESHYKLKSYLSRYHMTRLYKLEIEIEEEEEEEGKEKGEEEAKNEREEKHNKAEKESKRKAKKSKKAKETGNDKCRLKIERQEKVIEEEFKLDGRFFIQTEVDSSGFDMEEIVRSYKSLMKIERAFRIIKEELDIRPVYVRKETRIRGHVMICYFSLLVDILIENKMREIFPDMEDAESRRALLKKSERSGDDSLTMKTLMEELDTVRLVPLYINGNEKPLYISTRIGNNIKKLFSALGIRNAADPGKLRIEIKKSKFAANQLEFNFR